MLAVLPLRRWPCLPFAALVIGSTVPDLCLYLPFRVETLYQHAHSLHGLATINLGAGLVLYALWRGLLHAPLRDLLPAALRARVAPPAPVQLKLRPTVAVAAALILGSTTHVLWDTFTHHDRWGVDMFPGIFNAAVQLTGEFTIPVHKLIQHGSTVVGLPLLAGWIVLRWWQSPVHTDPWPHTTIRPAWRGTMAVVLALLCIAATASAWADASAALSWRLHHSATRSGAAMGIGLLAYAAVWQGARWFASRRLKTV